MQKKYSIVPFTISFLLLFFSGKVSAQCDSFFPTADTDLDYICSSSTIEFKVSSCTGAVSGTWSVSGVSSNLSTPTLTNETTEICTVAVGTPDNGSDGSFTLNFTNSVDGSVVSKTFNVDESHGASSIVNVVVDVCSGKALQISTADDIVYHISTESGDITLPNDRIIAGSNITDTYTNSTSDPIDVVYHSTPIENNGANACWGSTYTITATINPLPDVSASFHPVDPVTDSTVCVGADISMYGMPSAMGNSYDWEGGTTPLFESEDQNPTFVASSTSFGTYTLTVTDANTCSNTATLNLEEGDPLSNVEATFEFGADVSTLTVCDNYNVTMFSEPSGDYSYSWTGPHFVSPVTNQNPSFTFVTDDVGTYTVVVTDNQSACSNSAELVIAVGADLTVGASFSNSETIVEESACDGQMMTLYGEVTVPDGESYTYQWKDPQNQIVGTDKDVTITTDSDSYGTYTFTVTAEDSCKGVATLVLMSGSTIEASASFSELEDISSLFVCDNKEVTLYGGPDAPDGESYSYNWVGPNFSSGDQDYTVTAGSDFYGGYILTVTAENGCTGTASLVLNEGDDIVATASFSNDANVSTLTVCDGFSVDIFGGPEEPVDETYTYSWSGPNGYTSTSKDINVEAGSSTYGDYTLTVTSVESNCMGTAIVTLEQGTDIVATASFSNESVVTNLSVCDGFSVDIFGGPEEPVDETYTYSWSGPNGYTSTSKDINVEAGSSTYGDYILTVTSAEDNCMGTAFVTLEQGTDIAATASFDPESILLERTVCDGAEVVLYSEPTGGGYSYAWTGPSGFSINVQDPTVMVNGTLYGNYTVTVTETATGCTGEATIELIEGIPPTSSPSATDSDVCVGEEIELQGNPSGLASYEWSGPDNYSSDSQNPSSFTATSTDMAGTYTLLVTDSNGCTGENDVQIVVNSLPVLLDNQNSSICSGNAVNFDLSTLGTASNFTWIASSNDDIDGETTTEQTGTQITDVLYNTGNDASASVSYTVVGISSEGCLSPAVTVIINVQKLPEVDIENIDPNAEVCGDISHQVSNVSASYYNALSWTVQSGAGELSPLNFIEPVYSPGDSDIPGTVTLLLTATGDGACFNETATGVYNIAYSTAPEVSILDTPTDICVSGSYTFTNVTSAGGTRLWTTNGSGTFNNETLEEPTYTPGDSDAGTDVTLTLTITGEGSCEGESAMASYILGVDPLPTIDAGTDVEVCEGDEVSIVATGTNIDEATITWSENGTGSLSPTDALVTTYSSDINEGGSNVLATIQANGTNACSTETITDNLTITVNNNPTFTSADPICSDDRLTVTLSGTYTEANNITISPDIGVVSFSGGNYTITGFPAETSYSITFENTITGCSTLFEGTPVNCPCEGEFAVDNPSLTTNLSSCYTGNASDNNTFNVTNAGANEEVRWFNVNGDNPIFTGESFTPDNIDVGVYNYEVQIYNTQTNCGSERVTVTYTIHELPILTAEDEEICDGEVLTLTANVDNPVNPLSWNWSGGSGSIQNPNSQTTTVTGVTSNSVFTIEVTDGNSCSSLTNVNVLVNNVPTANIELVDDEVFEYCQGDPEDERPDIRILLTGGTPYSFVYKKDNSNITVDNHNSDEFIIENAEAGIYKLISVNNGCDGSVSDLNVEIIENVINPVTIQGADKVCENGTSILTATGDDYTNYEWSSGPNSADASSIEIALPNTYFVTVTNDKGCTAMDSKEVTLSKTVAAITPNVPSIDVCLGEEVTLQATNGGTNDSPNRYKWLGYENDTTFLFKTTPTEDKIIKVEVQNSYQCKDTAQVSIVVNEAIEADITVTDYNICDKDTFFLNLNNKDEFVEASFGTFGQYTPATGVYSFVGTQDTTKIVVSTVDNNGCEAEVEVNNLVRYELPFMAADEDEINVAVSESATFVISSFEIDERCDSDYGFTWFVDKKNGTNGVLDSDYETITTDDVSQLVIPADGTAGDTWEIFAVLNDACTCESSDTLRFILNIEKSSDCSIKFVGKQSKACVGEKVTLKAEGKSKFEFKDAFWSISYKDESGVETEISVNENSDNDNEFWQILTYTASSVAGSDNNSNGEFTFVCKKSGTYRAGYNLIHNDCETSKSSKVTVYDNPVMDVPLGAFPDTICYGDVINATLQFPEGDFNYKLDYTVNGDLFKGYVFDKNNKDLKLGKQTDKEVKINFNSLTSIYAGNFTCTLDDLNDLNVKVSVRDSFSYLIETDCDNDSISYQVYLFGGQKPYNVNVTLPGSTNADTYSIFTSSYFTDYNPVGEYFIGANSQCEESLDIKKFNEECIQCVPIESAVPSASLPEEDILVCTNKPYDVVIENINTDLKDIKYLVVLQKLNTSLVFNQSSVEKELNYQFNENNIELTIDYEELKDIVDVSPNIKYRIVIYPLPSVSGVYKEAPCEGAGFNISFTKPPSPTINATDLIVCKNQSNVILSHNAQNGTWFKDDSFTGEVNDFDTDDLYLNFTNVNFNDKFNFVLEETLGGCTGSDTISIRVSENENDVAPEVKNIYRYPGGIFVYDEEDLCYTWGVNNRSVGDFPEEVLHNRYFLFSNAIKDVPYNEDTHKVWVEVQYPEGADCNACTNRIYFNVLTPPKLGQNPFDSYAVKAFPNPVSDNLVIDIKGVHLGEFTIELWNTTGQMIEHKNVNKDEHTVRYDYDMSIHVPGLYLLKVIDENGFSNILKVVKQ